MVEFIQSSVNVIKGICSGYKLLMSVVVLITVVELYHNVSKLKNTVNALEEVLKSDVEGYGTVQLGVH